MLFLKPGEAKPIRGQCSLVSDKEIQKTIDFIKEQQEPIYDDNILSRQKSGSAGVMEKSDELELRIVSAVRHLRQVLCNYQAASVLT